MTDSVNKGGDFHVLEREREGGWLQGNGIIWLQLCVWVGSEKK